MSEPFSVDTDALRRNGANIQDVAELAGSILGDLNAACIMFAQPADGEIGRRFNQSYKPGETSCLGFLNQTTVFLREGGSRAIDVAGVYEDTNTDANTHANNGGRR